MPRHAKPIQLHVIQGNPNRLTKAEIERRRRCQVSIGDRRMKPPAYLRKNKLAYKRWKEIVPLFADVEFVSSSDVGFIARYCMLYAQYMDLFEARKSFRDDDIEAVEKYERLINSKATILMNMEDRMYLNPLAKVKNIGRKNRKEEDPLKKAGFDI